MVSKKPAYRVAAVLPLVALILAGCGRGAEDARAIATRSFSPPATILPLPTDTPGPTDTPPARAMDATAAAATPEAGTSPSVHLPEAADLPVVQIARVDAHRSEAGLLADLAPEFSLQSDGSAVFSEFGGPSPIDWYQTVLTPAQVTAFLDLLVNEVGLFDLANERANPASLDFDMSRDEAGNPRGPEALGVVYLRDAEREARLVLSLDELASPTDPHVERLVGILTALGVWRSGVRRPLTADEAQILAPILGWWSDLRQPWQPEQVVAYGLRFPQPGPGQSVPPSTAWPLETPLAELFSADSRERPGIRVFSGDEAMALLEAQTAAGLNPSIPLWFDAGDPNRTLYVVALRVNPPGGNHVTAPVRFGPPRPTLTPAVPGTSP